MSTDPILDDRLGLTSLPAGGDDRERRRQHQARSLLRPTADPAIAASGARPTPMIAVSGGKGGVGKTVVAVNLALLAQRAGYRVLLADLDPGLGNVDVHLRIAAQHTIEDLADGTCSRADAIHVGPGGVHALLGSNASTRLAAGDLGFLARVLDVVRDAAADYDLLVCDTGAGIGPGVIETLRRADLGLAITTADPAAVTDAYALCKVLHREGIRLPQLVMNAAPSRDEAFRTGGRLAAICEKFLGDRPTVAGWIRRDAAVERSVVEQRPCALGADSPLLEDLTALSATLLSTLRPPQRRKTAQQIAARRLLVR